MSKAGEMTGRHDTSTGLSGGMTGDAELAGLDRALEDLRLEAYWQRCLLATVILRQVAKAAETERMAAAAGGVGAAGAAETYGYGAKMRDWPKEIAKARAAVWDASKLPWSALVLGALWDERCPLTCKDMAGWIRGLGIEVRSVNALRATVKQLYGIGLLQRSPRGYVLDRDTHAYFSDRWRKRQGVEMRWGLGASEVTAIGTDLKEMDEKSLLEAASVQAIPHIRQAMRDEIARRQARGIWRSSQGVRVAEPAVTIAEAVPALATPTAVETRTPKQIAEDERIEKYRAARLEDFKKLPQRPADGSKVFSDEEGTLFLNMPPDFIMNLLSPSQKEAFEAWTDVFLAAQDDDRSLDGDGVRLYSSHHPAAVAVAAPSPVEEVDGAAVEAEQTDDTPSDIDVIYPTEDELAAILRGEVVGPAAPMGFEESLEEDS